MGNLNAYIQAAAVLLPLVAQAGGALITFLDNIKRVWAAGEPTEADWAAIKSMEDRLRATLQAPLPPEA